MGVWGSAAATSPGSGPCRLHAASRSAHAIRLAGQKATSSTSPAFKLFRDDKKTMNCTCRKLLERSLAAVLGSGFVSDGCRWRGLGSIALMAIFKRVQEGVGSLQGKQGERHRKLKSQHFDHSARDPHHPAGSLTANAYSPSMTISVELPESKVTCLVPLNKTPRVPPCSRGANFHQLSMFTWA